jgi:tetratricopeptide (TPR) repeat protein
LNLLGRNCARTGRFEEALVLLDEARQELEDVGAQQEVLDTDAKLAECRALMGDADEALSVATEALERSRASEGGSAEPLLELVRGYALSQLGRAAEGKDAFERCLDLARERGGAHFEMAMGIAALQRVGRWSAGKPVPPLLEQEGRELQERLEIIGIPVVPIAAQSQEQN